jgi:hypothetical protein
MESVVVVILHHQLVALETIEKLVLTVHKGSTCSHKDHCILLMFLLTTSLLNTLFLLREVTTLTHLIKKIKIVTVLGQHCKVIQVFISLVF